MGQPGLTEPTQIFGQLATMVSEQSEMIQRIDANTEDVVDNVQGAQRGEFLGLVARNESDITMSNSSFAELLKYWGRVSSNRWLIAVRHSCGCCTLAFCSGSRTVSLTKWIENVRCTHDILPVRFLAPLSRSGRCY